MLFLFRDIKIQLILTLISWLNLPVYELFPRYVPAFDFKHLHVVLQSEDTTNRRSPCVFYFSKLAKNYNSLVEIFPPLNFSS